MLTCSHTTIYHNNLFIFARAAAQQECDTCNIWIWAIFLQVYRGTDREHVLGRSSHQNHSAVHQHDRSATATATAIRISQRDKASRDDDCQRSAGAAAAAGHNRERRLEPPNTSSRALLAAVYQMDSLDFKL